MSGASSAFRRQVDRVRVCDGAERLVPLPGETGEVTDDFSFHSSINSGTFFLLAAC